MDNLNYTSRRDFISKSLFSIAALTIPWHSKLFSNNLKESEKAPDLFFTKKDLPRIRENIKSPILKNYWDSLVNADIKDDYKFLTEELDIHNHVRHLSRANEMLKRSSFVALAGENKEHEKLAKLAIEKILTFNEWDYFTEDSIQTIGFQRAPETTMSMSFAYDWLFDELSSSEKKEMLDAIALKGVPPCYLTLYGMKNPDKVKGWGFNPTSTNMVRVDLRRWPQFLNYTNLKMIPIAGLMIGSILLQNHHPESKKWLDMAKMSLEDFSKVFGKDGSYHEGVSYWSYTTQQFILSVDILKRHKGIDYINLINFPGTAKYALAMQMPTRNEPEQVVNFGDVSFSPDATPGFWIAKKFNNGTAKHFAEFYKERRNIFALVWNDDSIKAKKPDDKMNDLKFDNGTVVSRSGWDADDTVIALRSGGPANHEHADRNSIILKAYGERLFHDPLKAAYLHQDKLWLLRFTESHNSALIDGKGHQYHDGSEGTNSSKAVAKIVQYKPGKKITVFTSDATNAYYLVNTDVTKVQRTVVFIKPDIIILIDEFGKDKTSSTYQLRFQAYNVDGKATLKSGINGFETIRPYAKVTGNIFTDIKYKINQGKLDVPEDKGIFPYVEISTEPAKSCTICTVCAVNPITRVEEPKIEILKQKDGFTVHYKTLKDQGTVKVKTGKKFPVIYT
jgi:hypothetical protein